jgi:hypothetical protein
MRLKLCQSGRGPWMAEGPAGAKAAAGAALTGAAAESHYLVT